MCQKFVKFVLIHPMFQYWVILRRAKECSFRNLTASPSLAFSLLAFLACLSWSAISPRAARRWRSLSLLSAGPSLNRPEEICKILFLHSMQMLYNQNFFNEFFAKFGEWFRCANVSCREHGHH